MSYRVIEASEIVEYVYCRRNWWLRRMVGHEPHNVRQLADGEAFHQHHRSTVEKAFRARQVALVLIFLAMGLNAFWFVMSL